MILDNADFVGGCRDKIRMNEITGKRKTTGCHGLPASQGDDNKFPDEN
jgi:hypothetical protein